MASARIRAKLFSTEDPGAVKRAVRSLFPDSDICGGEAPDGARHGDIVWKSSNFSPLAEVIANHRIRDSARAVLLRGVEGNATRFFLSKQAATEGKASFTDGTSVLGDVEITIESEDILSTIDLIAASTRGSGRTRK
jgi:predicted RNA binding protein with dsRBD fold (UPF0201 family)